MCGVVMKAENVVGGGKLYQQVLCKMCLTVERDRLDLDDGGTPKEGSTQGRED